MSNKSKESVLRYNLRIAFTGFSMGLADLVPGVSGGTIALLYGIYDELLFSVKTLTGEVPRLLLRGKFREAYKAIPFKFLAPLAVGLVSVIFGMVSLISFLLTNYPTYVWSVFFGLVMGSALFVARRIEIWNANRVLLAVIGAIATYMIVGLPVLNTAATPLVLFGSGVIAISAMILPGISGSLILVLLGQYKNVLSAVDNLEVTKLVSFALGAITGLAIFSRLLSWLLREHHNATIAFLVGVMIGSLRKIWPWQNAIGDTFENYIPTLDVSILIFFVLAAAGLLAVWQLEKLGVAKEHEDIEDKDFIDEVHSQHD